MTPDEQPSRATENAGETGSTSPRARRPRRRGGRGGRRRRSAQGQSARPAETVEELPSPETVAEREAAVEGSAEEIFPTTEATAEPLPSAEVPARSGQKARAEPPTEQRAEFPRQPASAASVSSAIQEVNEVMESLRETLDQMEEVLEILELAEREKTADEREIEQLRQALRQVPRPRDGGRREGGARSQRSQQRGERQDRNPHRDRAHRSERPEEVASSQTSSRSGSAAKLEPRDGAQENEGPTESPESAAGEIPF